MLGNFELKGDATYGYNMFNVVISYSEAPQREFSFVEIKNKTNSVALSPRANYTN
jgi:plasmid replication initiation protein